MLEVRAVSEHEKSPCLDINDAGTRALWIQLLAGERLLRCHPRLPAYASHSRSAITLLFYNGNSRLGILAELLSMATAFALCQRWSLLAKPAAEDSSQPSEVHLSVRFYRILSIAGSL